MKSHDKNLCYHLHSAWVLCHHIDVSNAAMIDCKKLMALDNQRFDEDKSYGASGYPAILMLPMFWKDLGTVMFWPQKCLDSLP